MSDLSTRLRGAIRDIPDFPKRGIVFKDITPVLMAPELFKEATDAMAAPFSGERVSHVVAIESRGFILGAPIAQRLGAGFIPMRKPGKLPHRVERVEYALEYGIDALEVHGDALGSADRVLIADDVLATGGTAAAACQLVEKLGARVVGFSFLITLSFLAGEGVLKSRRVERLVRF